MSEQFDFNKAVEALKNGQNLNGKDGILIPLIKQLTEAALNAHLANDDQPNRRNGKTVQDSKNGLWQLSTGYTP